MKKRLRKKLHKGEYAVFGFHIEFLTKEKLAFDGPGDVFSEALDAWAHERGYCCAPGGDGKRWGCFVVPDQGRENKPHPGITEDGREAIWQYVRALPEMEKMVVGPLTNAYDDDEKMWYEFCRMADEKLGTR